MASHKLLTFRGDDFALGLNFTENGSPINITGWTIFFTIKRNLTDSDAAAVIAKTITSFPDAVNGEAVITLDDTETDDLQGDYYYDVQMKKPVGLIKTIVKSIIRFEDDVTLRTT